MMIQKYFVFIWGVLAFVYANVTLFVLEWMSVATGGTGAISQFDFIFNLYIPVGVGLLVGFFRKRKFLQLVHEKQQNRNVNPKIVFEGLFIGFLSYCLFPLVGFVFDPGVGDPIGYIFFTIMMSFTITFGSSFVFCILVTWVLVNMAVKNLNES